MQSDDGGSSTVSITVLAVTPTRAGRLFALASVAIDIDGIRIEVHGIRVLRDAPVGTRIELPKYRGLNGEWQTAIKLPEEVRGPIGDAVLDELIERAALQSGDSACRQRPERCRLGPSFRAGVSWISAVCLSLHRHLGRLPKIRG
jgi:stage V sporulation protein G